MVSPKSGVAPWLVGLAAWVLSARTASTWIKGERAVAKPESVFICIGTYPDAAAAGRQTADNAWRALADPAAREAYDVEIGSGRPGEGF